MQVARTALFAIAGLAGLACAPMAALAQEQTQTPQTTPPADEIVVTGQRSLEETLGAFVGEVSESGRAGQLARWDRKVCPGVIGLKAAGAQGILDRIAWRAQGAGLAVGEPGCDANILVLVVQDSTAVAKGLVDKRPRMFGILDDGAQTRGRAALRNFAETDRMVRWWHIEWQRNERGEIVGIRAADGSASVSSSTGTSSRLRRNTRQDFGKAIIIVDAQAVLTTPLEALADFVAMVALAQISLDTTAPSAPSILSLFSERAAGKPGPTGWTTFDETYVAGLYGADRYARNAKEQERAIARSMRRKMSREPEPEGQQPNKKK